MIRVGVLEMKGCSKVLVTGVAGFIGSHLVDVLVGKIGRIYVPM